MARVPPSLLGGGLASLAAVGVLAAWLAVDPTRGLELQVPGMDGSEAAVAQSTELVAVGELFEVGDGAPADLPGSWPGFRGLHRDNISPDRTPLARSWGEDGPPVAWSLVVGEGHAAPAVHGGRVYLLDYDEERGGDALRCLSLADGREIWRRWYRVRVKRNHGLSRTVPAVTDRWVVTIGPRGHVMCVDAETGALLWGLDLERDWGTTIPFWYTGQCPLIDGDVAVIAPAGSVLMMGVDCATGEILWQTPNPRGLRMSHTSIVEMVVDGVRMYVYSAVGGTVGVAADGPRRGALLWESTAWTHNVLAPTPVVLPGGRLFVTAGYGAGSGVLEVSPEGDAFRADLVQRFGPGEGLASEQQTPVNWGGRLLAIQPKDGGELRNQLLAVDPGDATRVLWASGPEHRFGLGPYLVADDRLLLLDDDGTLTLAELSDRGYHPVAKAKVLDGVDAWGPLALAGGRLLLRDLNRLVCLDLRADREGEV